MSIAEESRPSEVPANSLRGPVDEELLAKTIEASSELTTELATSYWALHEMAPLNEASRVSTQANALQITCLMTS
jgi:hypothetical protein